MADEKIVVVCKLEACINYNPIVEGKNEKV